MERTTYQNLGLTKEQVLEIQHWLFPLITDPKKTSISEIMELIIEKYNGKHRQYTLYFFGHIMGQARVKEKLGIRLILNPDVID